jgi:hypothetical protein
VEISIEEIPKLYDFPLVWQMKDGKKVYCDEPCGSFYLDKTALLDLIEFYPGMKWTFNRGYFFDEGFNDKINVFIESLFKLRVEYKKQKNPLQETIKLLLNSIYGKSILKAVDTQTVVVDNENLDRWVIQHQNSINEISVHPKSKIAYCKIIKQVNLHFNLPQFGSSVLSWSKRLMNRVMCLAQQNSIKLFYQDTDSIHLLEADIPKLQSLYKEKYSKELIGTELGQFHCDFNQINGLPTHSIELIAVGKKSYIDVLENTNGEREFHIRLKGIPQSVILNYCQKQNITVHELYHQLYDGVPIKFNLLDGSTCFRKDKTYAQYTPELFTRMVQFE